ncbi:MAG: hypothetical protein J6K22_07615 [Spirochaetaceae bacterium]|nr:hypothetical protein [Spirochaetaceae bacterium]
MDENKVVLNTAPVIKEFYSIDTRDLMTWEVIYKAYNLSGKQMHNEILALYDQMNLDLESNGLKYSDFKKVLVPDKNKTEACFIFDSEMTCNTSFYGYEILNKMLPYILEQEKIAVFIGDIIYTKPEGVILIQKELHNNFPKRDFSKDNMLNKYFVVYLNNITTNKMNQIKEKLSDYQAFVGAIDMAISCFLKDVLSVCIGQEFVKIGNKIITSVPEDDFEHASGYLHCTLPDGYEIIPINEDIYSTFLCYKIARSFNSNDILDQQFGLSSVCSNYIDLSGFTIEIEDEKLKNYLQTKKAGTLQQAGLTSLSKESLIKKIEEAINTNTLYDIRLRSNGVILFFTQIELITTNRKIRYILSLEVKVDEKKLRVITMY